MAPKNHDIRWANLERAQAMHALRSSNAAQPHVPRPRKGTRTERERQAIRDQMRERGDA